MGLSIPLQIPQLEARKQEIHRIRFSEARSGVPGVPARPSSPRPSTSRRTQLPRPLAWESQHRPRPLGRTAPPCGRPDRPPRQPSRGGSRSPRPAPSPPNGRPGTPAQRAGRRRTRADPASPARPACHSLTGSRNPSLPRLAQRRTLRLHFAPPHRSYRLSPRLLLSRVLPATSKARADAPPPLRAAGSSPGPAPARQAPPMPPPRQGGA